MHVIKWWNDRLFSVHNNIIGQKDATMSTGKGLYVKDLQREI